MHLTVADTASLVWFIGLSVIIFPLIGFLISMVTDNVGFLKVAFVIAMIICCCGGVILLYSLFCDAFTITYTPSEQSDFTTETRPIDADGLDDERLRHGHHRCFQ